MKAVLYELATDTFSLPENATIPIPGPEEIRVKVLATSLNPVDAKVKYWKASLAPSITHITLGLDVCGIVDEVGSDVNNFDKGDYVLYHGRMLTQNGGFAEYAIHDAFTTVNLGKSLSLDPVVLAATPCAAWTAYRALFDKLRVPAIAASSTASVQDDRTLCVIGASGGVGSFAVQLARLAGVKRVIGVCSTKNLEHVRHLGAHDVIDYKQESSIHEALQRLTNGEGIEMILDCVGSETTNDAIRSLKYDGMVCPIVSFAEGDLTGFLMSYVYCQISLGAAHRRGLDARKRLIAVGNLVTELVIQGKLQVPVTKVIGLEEVPSTLSEMISANNTGKIVLRL